MKLAIISHTEHYNKDGNTFGWGPTVSEINHLAVIFDEIWHVAVLREDEAPPSALAYETDRIHFIPLKAFGGPGLKDKLGVLLAAPSVISTVSGILKKVDCWQFRAPTGIGVFLIPYLSLFNQKPGWFKYAGNWDQQSPPPGYRLQRLWLSRLQSRNVTINGRWPGQPGHCLSFENPCLTETDRAEGWKVLSKKSYTPPWKVCFVGGLTQNKGVDKILKIFDALGPGHPFAEMHVVGDGPLRRALEEKAKKTYNPFKVHGALPRQQVFEIYKQCHFLVLPSQSEGFAKVIAEAANFGCIPLASAVASIPQYIRDGQEGFLWEPENESFTSWFHNLVKELLKVNLKKIAEESYKVAGLFTFDRYLHRINHEILKLKNPRL